MTTNYKEVDYNKYCPKCQFEKYHMYEDPCHECLSEPCREGTVVPAQYKEKEGKR